ncbi:reverse transcriptase domain-containing protein [Tanacetum coccineum]
MCIDFKDLNKACPKDLYLLPEIEWKIESLMGFQYKYFLDAYKGYQQIQMTKSTKRKTAFPYRRWKVLRYYTKMPFGLKNAGATYQRLVDSVFKEHIGVNLEAYVDDMVIKITSEGIRANPEKTKVVMDMPSPRTLKQMQSLSFRWTKAAEAVFLEIKKLVSELPTLTTLKKGETLMMGINKLCSDGETRSGPSLLGQTVKEVFPSSPDQGAYDITYVPRVAVKGQVLADFLADTSTEINATPEVGSTPRMEDITEYSNARENLTPGLRAWRPCTDGASNNGGSRAGLILIALDYYKALLAGLRIATEMQMKDIHAFVDSKLVTSQVEGSYEAKGERMIKYREKLLELAGAFNRFRITHIPRAENKKADALSKLAAIQFDHLSKEVLVKVLNERFVEAQEVNMVVEEKGPTWMTSIRNYLEKGILLEDPVNARTLMEKK